MAQAKRWMLTGIGIIAALIISIALLAALPARAFAADISSDIVTSLTADSYTINTWHVSTFTLEFSEDDSDGNLVHNIQGGDTITVSWPTQSDSTDKGFYLVGSEDTFDLTFTPEGSSTSVTIGQAEVTRNGTTITFNSEVENYQHVSGRTWFTAQTYNTGSPDDGTEDTMKVTSGTHTVTLNVTHHSDSGSGPVGEDHIIGKNVRFYQNNPATDTAEWGIQLNSHYATNLTGTVTVTDTLSEKLDAPEFVVGYVHYKDSDDANQTLRITSQSDFQNVTGANFSYSSTDRTLTITVPASTLTNFSYGEVTYGAAFLEVYFNTAWNSGAQGGDSIENTANVTYYTTDNPSESQDDHATTRFTVPSSGAEVSGVQCGTLQLTKVVNGTTVPIQGVTFRVYRLTGDGGTHVSGWYEDASGTTSDYVDITTDANGLAKLTGLDDGFYEVTEVAGPDWVVLTTQKIQVQLTETAGAARTIPNSIKTDDITATKSWLAADGTTDTSTHPTIYFKLYRAIGSNDPVAVDGADIVELADGTTSATWEDLPLYDTSGNKYTYSVKEVDADGNDYVPDGYSKEESGLTVTNTELGRIELTKVVDGTTTPIEGVTFRVYKLTGDGGDRIIAWFVNEDGSTSDYAEITTDANGIATLEGLDDGYYEIAEASGPDWVVLTDETRQLQLSEDSDIGRVAALTVENEIATGDITATKTWLAADGTADTSAHPTIYFQLYRAIDGEDAAVVEDADILELADGTTSVTWEGLPLYDNEGNAYTYSVKEVDADGNDYVPAGYTKQENGLTVTNTKAPTEETTTKTDTPSKMPNTGDGSLLPIVALLAVAITASGVIPIARRKSEKF